MAADGEPLYGRRYPVNVVILHSTAYRLSGKVLRLWLWIEATRFKGSCWWSRTMYTQLACIAGTLRRWIGGSFGERFHDEKNQIMTTNMWVIQEWKDANLQWNPQEYGGVTLLYVPSKSIWLPDIVLYNNADGDYTVTMMTKATLSSDGVVRWEPPSIFKSQCDINVEFFPFDEQNCHMKFGSWTYDGDKVDLRHIEKDPRTNATDLIPSAINLDEYYPSVEFDIMSVPAKKNIKYYPCCTEPYPDVTFNITIRRKTLYYTINLIIPTVSINMLTVLAFYLPSHCGEKISVCISILLSLSIFQLLLMDLVPATSIKLSLMGRYIMFTCILVTMSIMFSVFILNINYRSKATHEMSAATRWLLLRLLPKLLLMEKPDDPRDVALEEDFIDFDSGHSDLSNFGNPYKSKFQPLERTDTPASGDSIPTSFVGVNNLRPDVRMNLGRFCEACVRRRLQSYPPNIQKGLEGISFIAKHLQDEDRSTRVKDEWRYAALVVDRVLLWIYVAVCFVGGLGILMNAPVLYDDRQPLK
ncbi:hypothetical protein LSH36_136g05041 [Paralvinella palmiformis]|uniref:Uncharacterized protein n=1 Tax=Paralvinella palmiformis TaxID=53620 RepID=A0AAD9N9T8_9ANNE|nr:hypothetical protein LSH36_136g05041 [Paralvinella palmiformis]